MVSSEKFEQEISGGKEVYYRGLVANGVIKTKDMFTQLKHGEYHGGAFSNAGILSTKIGFYKGLREGDSASCAAEYWDTVQSNDGKGYILRFTHCLKDNEIINESYLDEIIERYKEKYLKSPHNPLLSIEKGNHHEIYRVFAELLEKKAIHSDKGTEETQFIFLDRSRMIIDDEYFVEVVATSGVGILHYMKGGTLTYVEES